MKDHNLKIVEVPVEQLNPADYNPRTFNEVEFHQLTESIQKFGFIDPIIANNNIERRNIVIGGHFRLKVAKALKMPTVPVVYLDIADIKEEKELNVRLNRNTGKFDYDVLANYYDPEDLIKWGFSYGELGMVMNNGKDLVNIDDMSLSNEAYDSAEIKSLALSFPTETYNDLIKRMDTAISEFGIQSYTELFIKLIEEYENRIR